uniref:RNA helicase n=1 Tax=Kalanchoe fedtschenkoi TaxID=63787 RepID=A0A7N0V7U3_KALFE
MLIQRKDEKEVISKEKKDRRDFKELSQLASSMGLHSRCYTRVIVFSKVPLPSYRSDLDDKRPQRELKMPLMLQQQVHALLREHGAHILSDDASLSQSNEDSGSSDEELYKPGTLLIPELKNVESMQLRKQQHEWQESLDGQKMLEFRRSLPCYKKRDVILKAVSENQVVLVSGETGCGKTTQLPQYILESDIEMGTGTSISIICTQPRRMSAMTVSERVAAERGEKLGGSVGYKVRLDNMKGRNTQLLYCTTGILLRRLLCDRNLGGVTHVIIDEIHERGMNEDFLLVVLKDLLPRRPDLRLILMSATLDSMLFSSYFSGAPTIHIPGHTYPVRSHFLENILEKTRYRLTHHNQTDHFGHEKKWRIQSRGFGNKKTQITTSVEVCLEAASFKEYSLETRKSLTCWDPESLGFNLIEHVLCHIVLNERLGAILVFMMGWDDIMSLKNQLHMHPLLGDASRVMLLACHGSMASFEQELIFRAPSDGVRKIVLATNVAETSITINDVVFVIDCGKAKETSYDAVNNASCLLPSWISKAAVQQRRGRAGRVQPGECYHLYPRCVYETFFEYQLPEILRMPLESVCLQIKSLQLGNISEFLSRSLQAPEALPVANAIRYLKIIGALDEMENLTGLGHYLSVLPVEPKLGKMLIFGAIFGCLDPVMTIVASLCVRDPFMISHINKDLAIRAKSQFSTRDFSDHLPVVRAFNSWKYAEMQQFGDEYCHRNFLSVQTMKDIDSLRNQLFFVLKETGFADSNINQSNRFSHDEHIIRAIMCAGLFPGLCSIMNKQKNIMFKTVEDGLVSLCSSSLNAHEPSIPFPWSVFSGKWKSNAVFLLDSTAVSDSAILLFGGKISRGHTDGHLTMMDGYIDFFMEPAVVDMYLPLRKELDEVIRNKLMNPKLDTSSYTELMTAVRLLLPQDRCEGQFVFGRNVSGPEPLKELKNNYPGVVSEASECGDAKNQLQTVLARAGYERPAYNTETLQKLVFRSTVMFNGLSFSGQTCNNKKLAEKDAANQALKWLNARDGLDPKFLWLAETHFAVWTCKVFTWLPEVEFLYLRLAMYNTGARSSKLPVECFFSKTKECAPDGGFPQACVGKDAPLKRKDREVLDSFSIDFECGTNFLTRYQSGSFVGDVDYMHQQEETTSMDTIIKMTWRCFAVMKWRVSLDR